MRHTVVRRAATAGTLSRSYAVSPGPAQLGDRSGRRAARRTRQCPSAARSPSRQLIMHVGVQPYRRMAGSHPHTPSLTLTGDRSRRQGLVEWFTSRRDPTGACDTTRTTARPAEAARESDPSNCGRNFVSWPSCSRKNPATYAVPTACCCFAVNRPAYFAPHGDSFSLAEPVVVRRRLGLTRGPLGVEEVVVGAEHGHGRPRRGVAGDGVAGVVVELLALQIGDVTVAVRQQRRSSRRPARWPGRSRWARAAGPRGCRTGHRGRR